MAKFKKLAMLCTALLATASMATLTACDLGGLLKKPGDSSSVESSSTEESSSSEAHVHTYDKTNWESNASEHWYAATCNENEDCADAKDSLDYHVDANDDGACDVCNYVSYYVLTPNESGEATVNATGAGASYRFVAPATATYKFSWTDTNLVVKNMKGMDISSDTEMTLVKDDAVMLHVSTADGTDASCTIKIEVVEEQQVETPTITIGGTAEVTLKQTDFFEGFITLNNVPAGNYEVSISGASLDMSIDALNGMGSYDTWGPELTADNGYTGILEIAEGYNVSLKVYFLSDAPSENSVTVTVSLKNVATATTLVFGENTMEIGEDAIELIFTAVDAATYVFSSTDTALTVACDAFPKGKGGGSVPLAPGYDSPSVEVPLSKGQTINLTASAEGMTGEFALSIAKKPVALDIDENTLVVTDFDANNGGAVYTFTAPDAATYVFSATDDNLNVECDAFPKNPKNPSLAMPLAPKFGVSSAEVTLTAGQVLELIVSTVDYNADEFALSIAKKLTIPEAVKAANALDNYEETDVHYWIEGVIIAITNKTYGNMVICDENGNVMATWGMYSADGSVRFDAMDPQPKVGDKITVLSHLKNHNAPQIQNPKLQVLTAQEMPAEYKVFAEGYALSTTTSTSIDAAGDVTVATVGATYDNVTISWASSDTAVAAVNGDVITYTLPAEATTVTLTATVTDGTTTKAYTFEVKVAAAPKEGETTKLIQVADLGIGSATVMTEGSAYTVDKISFTSPVDNKNDVKFDTQLRVFKNASLEISIAAGYKITSIVITTANSSSYMIKDANWISNTDTAKTTGVNSDTVAVTPIDGTQKVVLTATDNQVRILSISVTYVAA